MQRRSWRAGLAVPLLILVYTEAQAADAARPAWVQVRGQNATIAVDAAVGDVLVVDGQAEIDGVVRGHIYAVDGDIALGSHAVVLGSITLTRGALTVKDGARWPEQVLLAGAALKTDGPEPENIHIVRAEAPPDAAISLTKQVLAFDRFAPDTETSVRDLRSWHPGLELETKRFVENASKVLVGGITRLSFVSDKVHGSFQRGYRGERGLALFTGVQLKDADAALALWNQIASVEPKLDLEASVKIELGDGAHWFYRRGGRAVMLWHTGSWFFAVEAQSPEGPEPTDRLLNDVLQSLSSHAKISRT